MSPTDLKESATKESATKESTTKREIQVEVPVADVNRQTDTLIQKYQKVARIPGFRRGHVPASIIRQRFSEEIKTDMVEALVPRFFRQEAERLSLHPVSQPRVTDLHLHDGEPLLRKVRRLAGGLADSAVIARTSPACSDLRWSWLLLVLSIGVGVMAAEAVSAGTPASGQAGGRVAAWPGLPGVVAAGAAARARGGGVRSVGGRGRSCGRSPWPAWWLP